MKAATMSNFGIVKATRHRLRWTTAIQYTHKWQFMGYLPLVTETDARRVGFLYRIKSCNNSIMNSLYEVFSKYELQVLLYDVTGICSPYHFKY